MDTPRPNSPTNYYYADANNQPVGPLSAEQIHAFYQAGEITLDTLVIPEGATDWRRYSNIAPRVAPPQSSDPAATTTPPPAATKNVTAMSSLTEIQQPKSRMLPFILGIVFGIVISIVIFNFNFKSPKIGRVWFKVYDHAQSPQQAWYGDLCDEATGTRTLIIVDFGKKLDLAQDDRLQGSYVPTAETGIWNNSPYRIYKLDGEFKMVNPLSVQGR